MATNTWTARMAIESKVPFILYLVAKENQTVRNELPKVKQPISVWHGQVF